MKIDIRDNIPDDIAIELVGVVIRQGRISQQGERKYYCWITRINHNGQDYVVYVRNNRKTDCFVVTKG